MTDHQPKRSGTSRCRDDSGERVFADNRHIGRPTDVARCQTAAVLAGGGSRRMGRDKANVPFGAGTLLDQAVRRLDALADRVLVVGRTSDQCEHRENAGNSAGTKQAAREWHADAYPDAGPLGGITTALKLSAPHACLITPCDMPLLSVELLGRLVRSHNRDRDADCTLLMNPVRGRREPLVGVYGVSCLSLMEEAIAAGRLAIWLTLDRVTVRYLAVSPDQADQFANLNTPRDLSRSGIADQALSTEHPPDTADDPRRDLSD